MNKVQKIIVVAVIAEIIIMPLEGYSFLSVDMIMPLAILAIAFVAFGKKRKAN